MSTPLRALVVDDETLARQLLVEYCSAHGDIEVVGQCANGFEAVAAVEALTPDLIFLDVQMPRLNGFEVLELLPDPPLVVFVTAHDEFALAAFEVHACDYLLKPFDQQRFDGALDKVRERRAGQRHVDAREYAALHDAARAPEEYMGRVAVRRGGRVEVLAVADLDVLQAKDDHVALHVGGDSWLKQGTLSGFERRLDPALFVRVHRSWILNLSRLSAIEALSKDSHEALLHDGRRVPVSKSGHKRLKEALE